MNDKITEIKKTHADSTPMRYDNLAINAYEYITYLLQLVETQSKALREIDGLQTDYNAKKDIRVKRIIKEALSII